MPQNAQGMMPQNAQGIRPQNAQGMRHENIRERNYEDIKKSHNEIDPYSLYELEKGAPFSLSALKEKYKEYAYKTHPDNGGNVKNFAR